MVQQKILIVAPYPIAKPLHGGQKRASAIFKFYGTFFSEARFVGVFHRGQYPDWGSNDIPLGQADVIKKIDDNPYASELVAGKAIDNDIHVRSHMAKLLMDYKPEFIHIEQPYPYVGLKLLLAELDMRPTLIFGSQNIEYTMKDRIYEGLKIPAEIREPLVEQTKELEYAFSQKADLVIAVNAEDAKVHRQMGAKKCLVIPNGIDRVNISTAATDYWHKFKQEKGIKNIVTFVGSGHPPNWLGFLEMIGPDTSFMPPDSKIIIVGGVADYFRNEYKDKNKYESFWSGVELAGKLSEERLAALLSVTNLFILPIITERGSNLKTAEAILSGKKIVATQYALKGFEAYRRLPNIYIANNQTSFREAIIKALHANYIKPNSRKVRLANKVQWKFCFAPLEKSLEIMIYGRLRSIPKRVKRKLVKNK